MNSKTGQGGPHEIPAPGKLRQEDHKFKVGLGCSETVSNKGVGWSRETGRKPEKERGRRKGGREKGEGEEEAGEEQGQCRKLGLEVVLLVCFAGTEPRLLHMLTQ